MKGLHVADDIHFTVEGRDTAWLRSGLSPRPAPADLFLARLPSLTRPQTVREPVIIVVSSS